ncbi:hypothetical protein AG0111_0g11901 [Alternaria gaisen]|uniref:Uncharacterized protein n=1 Tax=Alternaria gaisen TaxID=167740 RepID=A0ACB6F630_9PLEO|nr:hypothetical protein AG0111_0g11901 [Alternaria gaisen]
METSTAPATSVSDPTLSGGAIAGIAIASVLLIALIIGGWYFWRRQQRVKIVSSSSEKELPAEIGGDGDILEAHTEETLQELSARDRSDARELDPTQYSRYTPHGAHELISHHGESRFWPAHELNLESQPGELSNGETGQAPQVQVYQQDLEPAVATTETRAAAPSDVEAQRRREMEWLEMEEERMRKRREMLSIQAATISESFSAAPPSEPSTSSTSSGIRSGAIAGIAIAAVLLIALVIGGWIFWHRKKKRTQQPTAGLTDDELARREGDGDKIVLDPHQTAPTTGAYQTQYQEMSGNGLTQELDRSHSYKHAIGGVHELKADDRPGELPFAGIEEHESTNGLDVVDGGESEVTPVPQTNRTATQAPQVSPHVEAQRRREVEWLEAEEMRIRQRREALLQQSVAKTEQ